MTFIVHTPKDYRVYRLEAGRRYDPTPWPRYILRLPA